jgi:hypothetical protein
LDSNLYTAAELTDALDRAGFRDVKFSAFPFWSWDSSSA